MNGHAPDASDEKAAFHQTGVLDDVNKGKEKEQEDVLPYLQNAFLEQQSVESGPLPIQRLDVRSTASSITSTMSMPPSPTKGGPRQNDEDVLPYLQNAVLEQHTAGEKPLQIQRLDGSLSDSGMRSPRSGGPPALASAFGASTTPNSGGKGATATPRPPVMMRHQPPPLPTSHLQQASTSAFASSSSPLSLHHASTSSSASASVFAAQQPPPFDHHHALSTTVASASMAGAATGAPSAISATHHVVEDAHYQPQHTITDHSLGGHGGYDGHHAGFDSHFGHGPSGFEGHNLGGVSHVADAHAAGAHQAMPSIGLGITRNHSAADAGPHLAGGHTFDSHNGHGAHAVDNHHGGGGGGDGFAHVADNHVGHDLNHFGHDLSHGGGGGGGGGCFGHAGADHHVQPPLSAHHVADAFVAPSPQPSAHHVLAAEYSHGGGHHVPDFVAASAGGGGGAVPLHHVSPPQSFRTGGFNVAPAAFSPVTAASGSGRSASPPVARPSNSQLEIPPVKQPSVLVLILLLVIIPVLSLSPYWGYHGPSTVSAFMMDEFSLSYLDLGLMFSLYSLPNLFMPFIAGNLIDKWGLSFSSLLFNIFCLLGNILLAITFYMPEKPISLLLISRVVFGFGGEAIIMCQQVMLTRWFSGTLLVVASGFVQIFVLCLGSGGAFLFLPHFGRDKVYISLMHVLFVSFWGFVFNLFYVALEWKWMPFLITKFINERQQAAKGDLLSLSRPATLNSSSGYTAVPTTTTTATSPNGQNSFAAVSNVQDSHLVDPYLPAGGHLALAPADGGAGVGGAFGGFADGHHAIADNHHAPAIDTHHALFGGSGGGGGCMGGGGHHVDNGHHFDTHALNGGGHFDAHHATDAYTHAPAPFDERHALNDTHFAHADVGSHFVAQPTPRFPSPAPQQTTPNTIAAISNVEDWGYFRIEGRAQILTRDGREEWENITIEGGGRIGRQGGRRVVDTVTPPASLLGGLRNRFRPASGNAGTVAPAPVPVAAPVKPSPAPSAGTAATPFLFYPRVFTSKTVGEDLQNLPFVYWLVVCMLFCVAPVLPAFTAFAPLFLQEKFGLGAIASSRAASLVYCVGAGAPFAAFLLAKLRVRSFIQLLTLGGVASFFIAFYFCGDDSFLPWFFLTGLGLLYCVVLGNGYAWVELTVPKELLGTATALSLAVTNAGMALAPFVVGLLREVSSDFDTALLGLLGFVAAGFFFASLVLVVDVAGQGVLIGAQPETIEAERAELRRLRALKQALLDAEDAQLRQREREAVEERELELEVRAEVEREVRRRRAERAQQRLQQQQPLPLATTASAGYSASQPAASSSASPAAAVETAFTPSASVSSSSLRSAERTPLLSPQQRTRSAAVGSSNNTNAASGKRL